MDTDTPDDRAFGLTSQSLLVRVRDREPEAWHRFVVLYSPLVLDWGRRAGLQDADTADVAQEVFRAVHGSVESFTHPNRGGAFRGWLRGITRHKIADLLRRKPPGADGAGGSEAHARLLDIPDDTDDADAVTEQDLILRRAVDLVLAGHPDRSRRAFLGVVVDGAKPAAVAAELGLTPNAVYLLVSRIKRQIREEFADLIEL